MVIWQHFLSYVKVEVTFIYNILVQAASIKKTLLFPQRCSGLTFTKMLSGSEPLLVFGSIFLNPGCLPAQKARDLVSDSEPSMTGQGKEAYDFRLQVLQRLQKVALTKADAQGMELWKFSPNNKQGTFPNILKGLCPLDKLVQLPSQEQDKNQAGFIFLSFSLLSPVRTW